MRCGMNLMSELNAIHYFIFVFLCESARRLGVLVFCASDGSRISAKIAETNHLRDGVEPAAYSISSFGVCKPGE